MKKYLFILGIALIVSGIIFTVGTLYGLIPNKVTYRDVNHIDGNEEWIFFLDQLDSRDKLVINLLFIRSPSQHRGTYEGGEIVERYHYIIDIYIKDSDRNTVKREQCSSSSTYSNEQTVAFFFFVRYDDQYEISCSANQWVTLYYEALDESFPEPDKTSRVSIESNVEVQKVSPNIFTLIIGLVLLAAGFISIPISARRI